MTKRLITHLRHIDLAVPDHGRQLDFFTSTHTAPISVVFQAPLGPSNAKISPAPMLSETPASAVTSR